MDRILRESEYREIIRQINFALANAEGFNYPYQAGLYEGTLKSILNLIKEDENTIGTTGIIWIKDDIKQVFVERYDREPSDKELNTIIEDYLDINDAGEEVGIEAGWNRIISAFDDYEKYEN